MAQRVYVIGLGMTKFEKPGKRDWDYPKMAAVATRGALQDAGVAFGEIEQAFVGYCYGDSTVSELGLVLLFFFPAYLCRAATGLCTSVVLAGFRLST